MSENECRNCGGDGVVWIDDGYDLGYGFPQEHEEVCPVCHGDGIARIKHHPTHGERLLTFGIVALIAFIVFINLAFLISAFAAPQ